MFSGTAIYNITGLDVIYGYICSMAAITLNLSYYTNIAASYKNIITGSGTSSASFLVTDSSGGHCGTINSQIVVTVPPSGGTASLITLSSPTNNNILFAATSLVTNVGVYGITIKVFYASAPSVIITSGTTSFTYTNPCSTAAV